jgi:hypothetical protein
MPSTAAIDTIDQDQWHRLLQEFDDASIFQSWTYGAARWGEKNLSHAVITQDGDVIGLAQAVLLGVPLFGKVLAYVIFGPLWQRHGSAPCFESLASAMAALREEYTMQRRLCLRFRWWNHGASDDVRTVVRDGAVWQQTKPLQASCILDLSRSENQLRAAMDKKWRANLRKSEQCNLTVSQQNDRDGVGIFVELHRQMHERKHFKYDHSGVWPDHYHQFPNELRPRIFVCWRDNVPLACAMVSALGNRAFYLHGANANAGLEARAGHFLQWTIVCWLKEEGRCRWYDLGAMASPGVRQFKRGLVSGKAAEVPMIELQARASHLSAAIVAAGSRLYEARRTVREQLERLRRPR